MLRVLHRHEKTFWTRRVVCHLWSHKESNWFRVRKFAKYTRRDYLTWIKAASHVRRKHKHKRRYVWTGKSHEKHKHKKKESPSSCACASACVSYMWTGKTQPQVQEKWKDFFVGGQTNKCIQYHSHCYPRWRRKLRRNCDCVCPCAYACVVRVNQPWRSSLSISALGVFVYIYIRQLHELF